MNYHQAVDILDRRREGADFSEFTVNMALELTGDLCDNDYIKAQESLQRMQQCQILRESGLYVQQSPMRLLRREILAENWRGQDKPREMCRTPEKSIGRFGGRRFGRAIDPKIV